MLARGQVLVTGDPAKDDPACVACHGAGLTGMKPGIPGLVGLRPTYIAASSRAGASATGTPPRPIA